MNKILRFIKKYEGQIYQLMIIMLPVIFFIKPIINYQTLNWGTSSLQFFPWMEYAAREILSGNIPLWNPNNGFGAPFSANYQTALFYPINWLLIIVYWFGGLKAMVFGYMLLIVLHFIIAAKGMERLTEQLGFNNFGKMIAIVTFIFSGYVVSRINFISMVWAYAWLPWVVFRVVKLVKDFDPQKLRQNIINMLLLGITIALQLLCGHAQTSFYTLIIAALTIIFSSFSHNLIISLKTAVFFIGGIILGFLLSAVQIIPTAEYLMHSPRQTEVGYEVATNFSFWPLRLISLFFGDFWGNPGVNRFIGGGNFWEDHLYIGVLPIIFMIIGTVFFLLRFKDLQDKFNKYFFLLSIIIIPISFLLALGKNFFLFPLFYKFVPGFDLFQAPSRFLILLVFCSAIMAGWGAEQWIKTSISPGIIRRVLFITGVVALSVTTGNFYMKILSVSMIFSIVFTSIIILIWGIFSSEKVKRYLNKKNGIFFIFLLILFLDLRFLNFPYSQFVSVEFYSGFNQLNENFGGERIFVRESSVDFSKFSRNFRFDRFEPIEEITTDNISFLPDTNLYYPAYAMFNNFDPLIPASFQRLSDWVNSLDEDELPLALSELGVTQLAEINLFSGNGWEIKAIEARDIVQWYDCAVGLSADEMTFDNIYTNKMDIDTQQCIFVSQQDGFSTESSPTIIDGSQVPVHLSRKNSDNFSIQYQSDRPGWVLIRELDYPGWQAVLDQETFLEIRKTNNLFKSIFVPAGDHEVNFFFKPVSFTVGIWVSAITIIILLCIVLFLKIN